jgi:hypothetical protein
LLATAILAGCSGYNSNSTTTNNKPTTPVTGLKKRVLLSNISTTGGGIIIMDAQKNVFAGVSTANVPTTISASQPSKMVTASGQTMVLNSTTAQVTVVDNATEQVTATTSMQGQPFDVAISPDGLTGYAAIKNVGVVEVVNTTTGNLVGTMNVSGVARLVEGPHGHKMLAFSDNPQNLDLQHPNTDSLFVIDTGTNTVAQIDMPLGSRPYTAVFDPTDTNDTTAFVLNCGGECGGATGSPATPTAPGVVKVSFADVTNPVTTSVTGANPIAGATVGLLNGSTLFVAGTPVNPPAGCGLACGSLQTIDTGSLTAQAPINITNGTHTVMALTSNNKLYIGASGCNVGQVSPQNTVQGCLSIFDIGAGASGTNPVFPPETSFRQNFDVTGLQPISNASTVYVVQGGELDFFDINLSAVSTTIQLIDVNGKAYNAIQIDP